MQTRQPFPRSAHALPWLEEILCGFGSLVIPAVLVVASVYSLFFLDLRYPPESAAPIPFRVLRDTTASRSPDAARRELQALEARASLDTGVVTDPFWILFDIPASTAPTIIDFPSRHAAELACWNGPGPEPAGQASRAGTRGVLAAEKAGFVMPVPPSDSAATWLCRARYLGPAKIDVLRWSEAGFRTADHGFHQASGLLEGSFVALSLLVFMFAVINREWTYVLFAGWLIANYRVGALSAGWDFWWLGRTIPGEWVHPLRQLAISSYIALTTALFTRLFRDELKVVRHPRALALLQAIGAIALLEALALPFAPYLPVMWATTAVGIGAMTFLLVAILKKTRSRVAAWYSLSMLVNIGASLYEIVAASFGLRQYLGTVNNVTGAIASSILAAVAIGAQMREERAGRIAAQALAVNALQKLGDTYRAIPIGLFTLHRDGRILQCNPAFLEILGVAPADGGTLHWRQLFSDDDWQRLLPAFDGTGELTVELSRQDGPATRRYTVKASCKDASIEGSILDVTAEREASDRLRFLADHDPLTGLLNRRGIVPAIDGAIAAWRPAAPGALAYVDLNRFKLINDLYGHVIGDDVLQTVSQRLGAVVAGAGTIGRIGGDEFVLVFPGARIGDVLALCGRAGTAIRDEPVATADREFQVGAAIGVIELGPSMTARDALATADGACREAKQSGRTVVGYEQNTTELDRKIGELRMMQRIGQALPFDRMVLEMQPILSLRDPFASLNFEILLRIQEPDGTVALPAPFLAAAEKNGQMTRVDQWVLDSALRWIEANLDRIGNTQFICLNLSGASINDERFVKNAFARIREHPRSAGLLCVEITEDVALKDLKSTRRFIEKLKALGVRVALDDFGAGYTSFSYLKALPADALKVDGQFVRDINRCPENYAIIRAIVELARQLGMQSIAEWAEDAGTVESLIEIGADHVQGWAIAHSMPGDRILQAGSAAGFIADPALKRVLAGQGAAGAKAWRERESGAVALT